MKRKQFLILTAGCLFFSILFMLPYLGSSLSLEHDTLFHLSRIEGLAQSFQSGKLIPDIYPLKNDGFGYASALFYCDLFLVPAALLYNAGCGVAVCYKITIFLATFFSCASMMLLVWKLSKSVHSSLFAGALYLFCSYRITDVYVRGALGEVIAMTFIPLTILGAYELLFNDKPKINWLIAGFTGLALSHNLTLLLGCIGFGFLLILFWRQMTKIRFVCLIKAVFITIGLSAFFLFPMLEQTFFQKYYLHYYASSSDLSAHSLLPWQYLMNRIVFGLSGNHLQPDEAMVVTPGIALLILPLFSLFQLNKDSSEKKFIHTCMISGYLFALICSINVPWNLLSFLRIMQFPWRFMTLACPLLCISASTVLFDLFKKKHLVLLSVLLIFTLHSLVLLEPCFDRPLVIDNKTTYEELVNGSIIDPYYANTSYHRIEVAGADYLPMGFLDYKNASHCITDLSGNDISCDIQKDDGFTFSAPKHTEIIVPLTAYKGYHVYAEDNEIEWKTYLGRISLNTGSHTEFTVTYEKTPLHQCSLFISFIFFIIIVIGYMKQDRKS